MHEDAISEVIRTAREEAGISQQELAAMAGVQYAQLCKLESDCASVSMRTFAMVVDALELDIVFRKPLDADAADFVGSLNVREYDTTEDFFAAQEWAHNAWRMAVADAAMRADLRESY